MPLMCLWAFEERLRLTELSLWVEQEEEEERAGEQQQAAPPQRQQPSSDTFGLRKPLSLTILVSWFIGSTWLIWLLLELVLL